MINALVALHGRAALRLRAAGQRSAKWTVGATASLRHPVGCQPNDGHRFSRCTD
jgi:hypothetical protein